MEAHGIYDIPFLSMTDECVFACLSLNVQKKMLIILGNLRLFTFFMHIWFAQLPRRRFWWCGVIDWIILTRTKTEVCANVCLLVDLEA